MSGIRKKELPNSNKTYCGWINDMFTINVIHRNAAEGPVDLNFIISIEK